MMKRVAWIASSREDLRQFPRPVQKRMGDALFAAWVGEQHDHAKPLKGFGGAAVLEIVERYDTDAYRAVYTVALSEAVYVLHAFQKKIERGTRDATTGCCHHPATLAGGAGNGRAVAPPA